MFDMHVERWHFFQKFPDSQPEWLNWVVWMVMVDDEVGNKRGGEGLTQPVTRT